MTDDRLLGDDEASFIVAVRSGDTARFALLTERYRRELQVHCYRMLANYEDAQDLTQETFLRAWKKRESFRGHAALRTWLYRIATNVCLDFLDKRNDRTPVPSGLSDLGSEVRYLQPYPDRMLPEDRRNRWWRGRRSSWRSLSPSSTCRRGSGWCSSFVTSSAGRRRRPPTCSS
jgi:DNA-directed RNA polymerase specialized sigma24 family protein